MKIAAFSSLLLATMVVLATASDVERPASSAGLARRHHAKQARAMEESHMLEKRAFKGKATWYGVFPGDMGACGTHLQRGDYFVALNQEQYGNLNQQSPYCGKKITITNGIKTTQATILDACPKSTQCHYGALDMSRELFNYFNDFGVGVFDITWWLGGDDNGGNSGNSGNSNKNDDDDDKKSAAAAKAAAAEKEAEEKKEAAAAKAAKEKKEAEEKKKEAEEKAAEALKKKKQAAAKAKKEKAEQEAQDAKDKVENAQNQNIVAFGEIMQQLNNLVENAVATPSS